MAMKIITYAVTDRSERPAENQQCVARILMDSGDFHPVIFTGTDAESLRVRAQTWWDTELEKARAKQERAEERQQQRAANKVAA